MHWPAMVLPMVASGKPGGMAVAVSGKGVQVCARIFAAKLERYASASIPALTKTSDVSASALSSFVSSGLFTSTPNAYSAA